MGIFIQSHYDNTVCEVKWRKYQCSADYYDIRYKGKKWTQEQISKDGVITQNFQDWMLFQFNYKDFDWKGFIIENDISDLKKVLKNSNDDNFRLGEVPLTISPSGGLVIHVERLEVRYTYFKKKKGYTSSYRDSFFPLLGTKKSGYHIFKHNEEKVTFDDYDFDGEKFTYNKNKKR